MINKNMEGAKLEKVIYSSEYRRMIFKACLIGSIFLTIFSLIDFFYTRLYLDATIEAIGCIVLLTLAILERKDRLNPLGIIFGLIVISTVIGSGAFSNSVENTGIVWIALVPFLSFFLLGEKLGLRVSILISLVYIAILTNIVIQQPEKGFNLNAIYGAAGALFCGTALSLAYEKNRTQMISLLAKQTQTDHLTSLLNRRGLIDSFEHLFLLSKRSKKDLCLLVLDLDNFKFVNDNFGHDMGDTVIKESANAANVTLRDLDSIARIGGEEFIAVLPNTSLEEALVIAEKIRLKIEVLTVTTPNGETIKITASIGVTNSTGNKTVFDDFFKAADEALYEAKNSGRNRVVFKE